MKIELRPLSRITPYDQNPRKNDHAVDAVVRSIQEFGFRQPIVVDDAGVILVGHTRYKAALKLELKTVPVHIAKGLSEAQARAYRLADNQTAELSEWDKALLPIELTALQELGFDLGQLGFAADDLSSLLATLNPGQCDPDDVPAPPDKATTKPGDLWILGNHRLQPLGHSFGIAELATRTDFGATRHWIPSCLSPFD